MSNEVARVGQIDVNARAAVNSALDLLNSALLYIDDARKRCVESGDVEGLMLGLENVTKFSAQLKVIIDSVRADLFTNVATWMPVPGGDGWVGVDRNRTDTWDSQAVLDELIRVTFTNTLQAHEGEVNVFAIVTDLRDAIFACAPLTASAGWRTKALKERGIDPEMYRERTKRESVKWAPEPPAPIKSRLLREKGTTPP